MTYRIIKNKKLNFFLVGVMLIVFLSVFVNAFSVGFRGSRLGLTPGQTLETAFSLDSSEENDATIQITVEEGAEYITFTQGTSFNLPAGENVAVPVRISVPQDANIGDVYTIKVLFKSVGGEGTSAGEGTNIGFVFNHRKTIGIEVIEELVRGEQPAPPKETGLLWIIGLGAVIVIIVIVVLLMKSKQGGAAGVAAKPKKAGK